MAKEQYRTPRKRKVCSWGIMSQTTKKGKVETKKDELIPLGEKLTPYKTKGLSPSTYTETDLISNFG